MSAFLTPRDLDGCAIEGMSWRNAVDDKLIVLKEQIDWNIRRLSNLVLSDEDRERTEDLVMELREEKQSLEWCSR